MTFELRPRSAHELPPAPPELPDLRGKTFLGFVVNPRDQEPVSASTDGRHVAVRSLLSDPPLAAIGRGYYDMTSYGESDAAERATGYPRVHTPDGVTPRGAGYGTCLYTALALAAYLQENHGLRLQTKTRGEGICSESENRSPSADAWWDRAVDKGLASRTETEPEEVCEEYVKLDNVSPGDLQNLVTDEGKTITYVNEVNVDMCGLEGDAIVVDQLEYNDAFQADLVAFEMTAEIPPNIRPGTELRWVVEQVLAGETEFHDVNHDALLALDVRGLPEDAIKLLSLAYAHLDLEDDIDDLWYRWQYDLDPGSTSPQLQLIANQTGGAGLAAVAQARRRVAWDYLKDLP